MKKTKKILAVLLSVFLLAGFLPAFSLAAPAEGYEGRDPDDPEYYINHVCSVFIASEKTLYVGLGDSLDEKDWGMEGVAFENHGTMYGPSDDSDFGDHNALWNEEENDEDWEIGPQIKKVVFLDEFKSPTFSGWFESFTGLTTIEGMDKVDTRQTEDMSTMFLACISLESLDLSYFNTANTEEMELMFALCQSLKSLDLSGFTTTENTRMNGMFGGCTSLRRLTLGENFRFSFKESLIEPMLGPDGAQELKEEMGIDLSTPQLTEPPKNETYTGYWVLEGSEDYRFTAKELMENYDGKTMAGTWVWELRQKSIADAVIVGSPQTYTGQALQTAVTVTLNGTPLTEGTDYVISGYENNVNAGTATVTVTGKGLYKDSAAGTFTVLPTSLSGADVSVEPNKTFTGSEITLPVTVKLGENTLTEGKDFTVSYRDNVNVGTATVTVIGIGNYKDAVSGTFTIGPADLTDAKVTVPDQLYTGEALTPAVTVTLNGVTLTAERDYTVQFANNTDITKEAVAMITGIGNHFGSTFGTFRIKPKDMANPDADFLLGDVDGNGKVEAADARYALRAAVGLDDTKEGLDFSDKTNRCFLAADVTKDKTILAADARRILRAAVGLETLS